MNKQATATWWNVVFIDYYATITTRIAAIDENDAISLANNLLTDYYDIDLDRWQAEADDTGEIADNQ
jgi:hypothetical protein